MNEIDSRDSAISDSSYSSVRSSKPLREELVCQNVQVVRDFPQVRALIDTATKSQSFGKPRQVLGDFARKEISIRDRADPLNKSIGNFHPCAKRRRHVARIDWNDTPG